MVKKSHTNYKANTKKSTDKVTIIPIGGLGQIGKNMMAIEHKNNIVIIDCGISLPDTKLLGVDLIIPDFSYIEKNKDKVKALLITHGHEDHIGGIPYLLQILDMPIYGTPLSLGLIQSRLEEHDIPKRPEFITITPRKVHQIGPFRIEYIQTTHSIADSCGIAIHTDIGTIVHTGDFKIDHTPIDDRKFDFFRFSQLGEEGVLLLLSDSTNVEKSEQSVSEKELSEKFKSTISDVTGRLYVATFSSHVHRIQQILDLAKEHGKKVAFAGKSMLKIVEIASDLGYLHIPSDTIYTIDQINKMPRNKTVIISSGSQGEPMSTLALIADDAHKHLDIEKGDTVVLAGGIIPGNEKSIGKIINRLFSRDAKVLYRGLDEVHVSGHGTKHDLKTMISLTKPKYFIPIHGEVRHLIHHSNLAAELGIPRDNIILAQEGDFIELTPNTINKVDNFGPRLILVDGKGVGDIGNQVLRERAMLADDGIFSVFISMRDEGNRYTTVMESESKGFVFLKDNENMLRESKSIVQAILSQVEYNNKQVDIGSIKQKVKGDLRKYFFELTKRKPVITVSIVVI